MHSVCETTVYRLPFEVGMQCEKLHGSVALRNSPLVLHAACCGVQAKRGNPVSAETAEESPLTKKEQFPPAAMLVDDMNRSETKGRASFSSNKQKFLDRATRPDRKLHKLIWILLLFMSVTLL